MEFHPQNIRKLPFFRDLPDSLTEKLFQNGRLVRYRKGATVFSSGELLSCAYLLLDGEAMIYNLTRRGNRKIIFILGGGHLLNHNLAASRRTAIFCEASSPLLMLTLPVSFFLQTMDEEPPLARAVLAEYERYIWRLDHQLKNTAGSMRVERKIAAKLWKLGRDFGVSCPEGILIRPELTLTVLADMVGAPRETISRACKQLSARQLLLYRNRHFILPDPEGLAAFYKTV